MLLLHRLTDSIRSFFHRLLPKADPSAQRLRLPRGYGKVRHLSTGGMGRVFSAEHVKFGRVAIKLAARDTAAARDQLRREARLTAALKHENVVRVHTIAETGDGVPYYTMPLVEGTTLRGFVERSGPLSPAYVAAILAQVCDVISALLARGLVHGDLKPSNIMLAASGGEPPHVTVLDFGLATAIGTVQRPSCDPCGLVGTPAYLAPEVLRGQGLSERSELYALGLVGYYLLAGRHAFEATTLEELERAHAGGELASPSAVAGAALPDELEQLISSCLAKQPEARPRSMGWLSGELRRIEATLEAEPTVSCSRPPILPEAVLTPETGLEATVPDLSVRFDTAVLVARA